MRNQLHTIGFGFILFGILLELAGMVIVGFGYHSGVWSVLQLIVLFLGLVMGGIGLALLFDRSHKE